MFTRNVGAGLAPALNFPTLISPTLEISPFYENTNSHALLNVEDILVFRTIGGLFALFPIAMQIKDIDIIETLQQTAAHAPKGGVIQITVISDEGQNTIAHLLNMPLSETHKFYVVITQPFCLSRFLQFWATIFVGLDQRGDPLAFVGRMSGKRWITQHYQYLIGLLLPLPCKRFFHLFQCIGQVDIRLLVIPKVIGPPLPFWFW